MTENFAISSGYKTDVGLQRSNNEDFLAVFDLPGAQAAFVVCDGMGGLRAGEVASGEATRVIEAFLAESFRVKGVPSDPKPLLRQALIKANDAVNALNSKTVVLQGGESPDDPTVRGGAAAASAQPEGLMGTTCVAGVVLANILYMAHAGDSRAYLWRSGALSQLTDDHSFVAERVKAGDITEAEAKTSKFRNVITRAIGIAPEVDPEVREVSLAAGDTVLVCTDGLTTMAEDSQIADALRQATNTRTNSDRTAANLVDLANHNGGSDNITVLLLKVAGDSPQPVSTKGIAATKARPAPAPAKPAARGRVVDIDAPRRDNGMSPIGLLIFGAMLAIVGLGSVLLFVPGARDHAASLLTKGQHPSSDAALLTGAAPDYRKLTYDAPVPFGDLLARGDLLSYSRDGGLYFVRDGNGAVMSLSPTGGHFHPSVASVEALGSTKGEDTPATHIFMTTDPQGNVYISYTKNQTIVKSDPDGKVLQTIHGFDHPEAIAVDTDGNIFVVDFNVIKVLRVHSATPKPTASPTGKALMKPPASPSSSSAGAEHATKPRPASPTPGSSASKKTAG